MAYFINGVNMHINKAKKKVNYHRRYKRNAMQKMTKLETLEMWHMLIGWGTAIALVASIALVIDMILRYFARL